MIDNQGDQKQDEKIKTAEKKTKKKLPAAFFFTSEESGKKCNKDIDTGDAQGDCLFAERKAIEQQGKQKERSRSFRIKVRRLPGFFVGNIRASCFRNYIIFILK